MPAISERLRRITGGADDGWALFYAAKELIRQGVPVVELTIGEHDRRTDPAILDAMRAAAGAGNTGYAPIPGSTALRTAIAARTERMTGVPTGPENVIVLPGGQAALFAAHLAGAEAGAKAVFVDPHYATYPGTIRACGLDPVAVQARPEDGFAPREAELMAAAAGARTLLVNSPNNPTGAVYGEATLAAIARVAEARDLWVISDEVYDAMVWTGPFRTIRALPGMAERTMVVGSMSKGHAMTGSRVGWIVAPPDIIDLIWDFATVSYYGIPGFIQDAALYALGLGPSFEAEVAAPFARRRAITDAALAGQQVLKAMPMDGGMYAMLDVSATGMDGEAFAHALLDAERIAVMPGSSFGLAARDHVRVAMTVADDAYADALRRIVRFAARA